MGEFSFDLRDMNIRKIPFLAWHNRRNTARDPALLLYTIPAWTIDSTETVSYDRVGLISMALETIPTVQRAALIHTLGQPVSLLSAHPVPDPTQLQPNECLIKIEYAGVCQSDLHARNGDLARRPTLPRIGGHEGVGIVVAIGAGTVESPVNLGDRVGLKFTARTCLNCDDCRAGNEAGECGCYLPWDSGVTHCLMVANDTYSYFYPVTSMLCPDIPWLYHRWYLC